MLCALVQGKQGVGASLQLLEGKLGVDQIMSLCQALGYFLTGAAWTEYCQTVIVSTQLRSYSLITALLLSAAVCLKNWIHMCFELALLE